MEDQVPGSPSLLEPTYWWYRARSDLLKAALGDFLRSPTVILDVGSADGPSIQWMRGDHRLVATDLDPTGLPDGGVCANVLALPFGDDTFDVVSAFDVIEHCEPEALALSELARVLAPDGHLLVSVPAYQWAWSNHDVQVGHHRRYTTERLNAAVNAAGLEILRTTHGFGSVFPFFAAERLMRKWRPATTTNEGKLPSVPVWVGWFLMALCRIEARVLRSVDVPFGSSIFLAARKPSTSR